MRAGLRGYYAAHTRTEGRGRLGERPLLLLRRPGRRCGPGSGVHGPRGEAPAPRIPPLPLPPEAVIMCLGLALCASAWPVSHPCACSLWPSAVPLAFSPAPSPALPPTPRPNYLSISLSPSPPPLPLRLPRCFPLLIPSSILSSRR